jgi:hypothetical protein
VDGEALLAITLELLPEPVDLVGLVLQSAGLGSMAIAAASVIGASEDRWARLGTVIGAGFGLGVFAVAWLLPRLS